MTLYIDGHTFHYELENLCRVFYPNEKILVSHHLEQMKEDPFFVYTGRCKQDGKEHLKACLCVDGNRQEAVRLLPVNMPDLDSECERELAVLLFGLLKQYTGLSPSWGILTGVRPIKLLRRLVHSEGGEEEAKRYFEQRLLVTPAKTKLGLETMRAEQKLLALSKPESYSLYVSIPFCPTRCSYCSFVSQSVEKAARLIPEYVKRLCTELEVTAQLAKATGLRLETVYIGGGTPTTLSADQLRVLLDTIKNFFDFSFCREFTVEAGRPDTITREKLQVLKQFGVDRISINPQTFHDRVLEAIGRKHTSQQTLDAYELARKVGFQHINMDFIAGLPEDTNEAFQKTICKALELAPESITIHTLSMKKSSKLTCEGKELYRDECMETEKMLEFAGEVLPANDYHPYYLYRQSRMVGNLENVGWAKPGFEGLYNVYVMDETHTVLACGAGAVTKLKEPKGEYLERVFNFKFPYEYNSRFDEMLERKKKIQEFYAQYPF